MYPIKLVCVLRQDINLQTKNIKQETKYNFSLKKHLKKYIHHVYGFPKKFCNTQNLLFEHVNNKEVMTNKRKTLYFVRLYD